MRPYKLGLASLLCLLLTTQAQASESQFGFLYTTDLLPKGAKEVEQWITWRHQKLGGTYDLVEGKTAYEYGASDDLQLAIYATYDWTQAYQNGPGGATTPPEQFSYANPGPNDRFTAAKFIGFSTEVIYRVLSPYIDPVGLAFYLEPTIGDKFAELEAKIILQKNYFEDTLTLAFNFTYAPEFRLFSDPATGQFNNSWAEETDSNFNFGASYRFIPNWWVGLEFLNEQERNSLNFTDQSNSGYYIGPNIHFGGKDFFVTALFLAQLPWATNHIETVPGAVVDGYLYDNDFERYRVRVKVGYYF